MVCTHERSERWNAPAKGRASGLCPCFEREQDQQPKFSERKLARCRIMSVEAGVQTVRFMVRTAAAPRSHGRSDLCTQCMAQTRLEQRQDEQCSAIHHAQTSIAMYVQVLPDPSSCRQREGMSSESAAKLATTHRLMPLFASRFPPRSHNDRSSRRTLSRCTSCLYLPLNAKASYERRQDRQDKSDPI